MYPFASERESASTQGAAPIGGRGSIQRRPKPDVIAEVVEVWILLCEASVLWVKGNCLLKMFDRLIYLAPHA